MNDAAFTPPAPVAAGDVLPLRLAHNLAKWSLAAALCALIPIPFLDSWAVRRMYKGMYRSLLAGAATPLPRAGLNDLLDGREPPRGCLRRLLGLPGWIGRWLIFMPVRRVLAKILFLFSLHDAVNVFSDSFHRGFLLHTALAGQWHPDGDVDPVQLHNAIAKVCRTAEARPVIQLVRTALRRSGRRLRIEAWRFSRRIGRDRRSSDGEGRLEASVDLEAQALDPVLSELENGLMLERGYFSRLAAELHRQLIVAAAVGRAAQAGMKEKGGVSG